MDDFYFFSQIAIGLYTPCNPISASQLGAIVLDCNSSVDVANATVSNSAVIIKNT